MRMYDCSVGHNCNLVIGEVVTPEGLVPESDIERLREFGAAVRKRFANPVGETSGAGKVLELPLSRPQRVEQVVLMEDIIHGERVRDYQVEGRVGDGTWQVLASGQSIGHKWIHRMEPVEVASLRLTVTRTAAEPQIRSFAAY